MKIPESELEFTFSRSAGAGGQNVNKVNTKATLAWDINGSRLSPSVLSRFRGEFAQFITSDGIVKITSQKYRTQSGNKRDCIRKLEEMLKSVSRPPKQRIKTKPKRSSIESRLKQKKNKSEVKKTRKKVDY